MKTYYELLPDGTIGRSTPNVLIAKSIGLTLQTEKEIVYGHDGHRYFKGEEPSDPSPSYIELRTAAYPSITDQLDMLYWDKINRTSTWIESIKKIKHNYPKE